MVIKLSKIIKDLKESVMLAIHEKPIPISLDELKQHNINIDNAIKELERKESARQG